MSLSPDEQFAALNTPAWLTAFRTKVTEVLGALESVHAHVPSFQFEVNGVPCLVEPQPGGQSARACIGQDVSGGWQFVVVAPTGWFVPA